MEVYRIRDFGLVLPKMMARLTPTVPMIATLDWEAAPHIIPPDSGNALKIQIRE
jgi:hypothetical protein